MSKKPDRKKPLGKALPRTDEDLDRLAQVSDDDIEAALAEATPEMRALLEATPVEDDEP
jgi:hypothetical protein